MSDHYRHRPVDLELLRAIAAGAAWAPVSARELAAELGRSVYSITAKLQALVQAGLVSCHRKPNRAATRAYAITEQGHDFLGRAGARDPRTPLVPARNARWLTR